MWLVVVIFAWMMRTDLLGVTSFVRESFLTPQCYNALLNFFHSNALSLHHLTTEWVVLCTKLFSPLTCSGYQVLVADGLKVPKEGKKMPAVKSLHQESTNNSKPTFIMGHSFQAVSMLVMASTGQVFAIPLMARICEGLKNKRSDSKTLLDKLAEMFLFITKITHKPTILVADAYYASRTIIKPLLATKMHHLVTRVRTNTVAHEEAPKPKKRGRGRPKKYGRKRKLNESFKGWKAFETAPSPVYGETNTVIKYRVIDLLWKPIGEVVRFVLVNHPTRGKIILLSTSTELSPLSIIQIYGYRFKIEVSFRHAIHTIGAYGYHFWMKGMDPISRGSGDQIIGSRTIKYRQKVNRKMHAYHSFVQIGCIVQGFLMHLAINFQGSVWSEFKSWFRTMNPNQVPTERVVISALKSACPEFLLSKSKDDKYNKFIIEHADFERIPGMIKKT